jgi:glycosyltransferase involved in cell wall biosynthesis
LSVLEQFNDERLNVFSIPHSGLPAVARNHGLRRASGEYIAFLDSDDVWLEDKLSIQVGYMDEHPEAGLIFTNTYVFRHDPGEQGQSMAHGENVIGGTYSFERLYGQPIIPNLTVMLRSSVVADTGLLDEDPLIKANEDYEYWLRVAERYEVHYLDLPLARYRSHSAGISKNTVDTYRARLHLIGKLDVRYAGKTTSLAGKRRRWLSEVNYGLGRAYLRQGRDSAARKSFVESFRYRVKPSAVIFLISTFLGARFQNSLDGLRTKLLG